VAHDEQVALGVARAPHRHQQPAQEGPPGHAQAEGQAPEDQDEARREGFEIEEDGDGQQGEGRHGRGLEQLEDLAGEAGEAVDVVGDEVVVDQRPGGEDEDEPDDVAQGVGPVEDDFDLDQAGDPLGEGHGGEQSDCQGELVEEAQPVDEELVAEANHVVGRRAGATGAASGAQAWAASLGRARQNWPS